MFASSPFFIAEAQTVAEGETELQSSAKDSLVQVAYRKVSQKDLLGGVSVVNVEELTKKNYITYSLETMQGYVGGWNGNSLWGMDSYLVLVDGVPREANNVMPTEIKDITFMKGASAVVLYGSRAANGVVYITTKRGNQGPLKVNIRANTGFHVAKSYPEYLGSGEYMTLYNEACVNDGLLPAYSQEDIYNYSSGRNPYRYADVNMYSSDYIKKAYNRSDVTAEISGGNERARYYTNISYYNVGDVLKFGEAENNFTDRFNVRGNVDFNIKKSISAYVNANVTFYNARSANSGSSYWNAAGSLRPNRISPLIPISSIDSNALSALDLVMNSSNIIDGKYFLAGTSSDQTNIFADYYASGYSKFTSRQFQFDTGINFDMSSILKGLSFNTQVAVDYATSYSTSYNNDYATYSPVWNNYGGVDVITSMNKYGEDKKSGVQNISGSTDNQTILVSGQFNYNNTFNDVHNLTGALIASGFQQTFSGEYHRTSNLNLGIQFGYNYDHKYYVDFVGAVIHSAKLAPGNRQAFSPSLTLGWNMKNNGLLKDVSSVNDMMLSVSGSSVNTDLYINDFYMYDEVYNQADGAWWGWREGISMHSTNSLRSENKDLSFIKRNEISVNLRTALFNRSITADVSYFINQTEGKIISPVQLYPSYFQTYYPSASFLPSLNFDNDRRVGFDFNMNFNRKIGAVDFILGVNGTYYDTKATKRSENFADAYQNRQGKVLDGVWGYKSAGFFESAEDIANWPSQTFGGDVQPGDIKYLDMNGDGVIDDKDQVYLGKGGWYGSPFTLGINLTAKWKGFTLFALGTGNFGAIGVKNSDYFWVSGEKKYSAAVRDRWTEETKSTASYPRLTTGDGSNNFCTSDFWTYKTDAFRLAKVQVTYDFPEKIFRKTFLSGLSAYVSGQNLLTISKEREILEMSVKSAPQTRFYNLGVQVSF